MWEIAFYTIFVPIITIVLSLISPIKYNKYFAAPIILFITLNIPTIVLPMIYHVGWLALFGWAVFYTFISLLISFIVWMSKKVTLTRKNV